MERIGHLVGIDPDEAALDPVGQLQQVVGLPGRTLAAEGVARQRRQEAEERRPAADLHLDQEGLALVDRHAAVLADRLQPPVGRQAALVHGVAGLVQYAHQSLGKVVFLVARGDAHIVRHTAAEGMQAGIHAAMVEVEANRRH